MILGTPPALLVKLADRHHNLLTLSAMPTHKQKLKVEDRLKVVDPVSLGWNASIKRKRLASPMGQSKIFLYHETFSAPATLSS
jgi:hypothetical protein